MERTFRLNTGHDTLGSLAYYSTTWDVFVAHELGDEEYDARVDASFASHDDARAHVERIRSEGSKWVLCIRPPGDAFEASRAYLAFAFEAHSHAGVRITR